MHKGKIKSIHKEKRNLCVKSMQFSCSSSAHFVLKVWPLLSSVFCLFYSVFLNTIDLDMKATYPASGLALSIWLRCLNWEIHEKDMCDTPALSPV